LTAYGPNINRLRKIKTENDPKNLFRLNHNIEARYNAKATI